MVAARLIDVESEGRQVIDRYELVAELASGGMATVFLARLSGVGGFQRFVAIKRLHPHLAGEQDFVDMFLDEARLAAGIHHPNVVAILEVGASPRGYFLAMEYIEGDTLARFLARAATQGGRIPAPIVIRAVLDMLAGLHAAHELKDEHGQPTGLVHRDVSPQNLLVGLDGICRITDFGVARAATRLSGTRAGQLKGKIAYMAPEQAMGSPDIDRRADVFASGIVLWEVLAGRRLFKAENEAATLSRVLTETIPDLRTVAPDVAPAISEVVMKALERDRDRRFTTCAEFADALERAATEAGVLATSKDLASYVNNVIGDEIAQQRDAVRAWLARSEPSQVSLPFSGRPSRVSTVSSASMSLRHGERSGVTLSAPGPAPVLPEPPPAKRRVGIYVGFGLLVLLLGGTGLLLLGRSMQARPAASVAPVPTPLVTAAPTATPEPTPAPTPSAAAPVEPGPSAAPVEPGPSAAPTASAKPRRNDGARPPRGGGEELPSNPYR